MSLVFDILHFVAAALLAVIGIGYEREEECDPVHYQPASYALAAQGDADVVRTGEVVFMNASGEFIVSEEPTPVSGCDSGDASVFYPVL